MKEAVGGKKLDLWNQVADRILQAAGLEDYRENYSFHLGRIKAWDMKTIEVLEKMNLVEDGMLTMPVVIVGAKDGDMKEAVENDRLRLRFNFLYGKNSVPYFILGYEENNNFTSLSDLWLSVLSGGEVFVAAKFKRDMPDYFRVSKDFTEPFINCLGISAERAFGVTLSKEAVNLFDFMARQVDLDPKNLSRAEQADYRTYLEKLQQSTKTNLIEEIAVKFGMTDANEPASEEKPVIEKPVIFDGDMAAALILYNYGIEKGLRIIIKNIDILEIIGENLGRSVEKIVRSRKTNQSKGDLVILIREKGESPPVILADGALAPFNVDSFNEPGKLAAILAKIKAEQPRE